MNKERCQGLTLISSNSSKSSVSVSARVVPCVAATTQTQPTQNPSSPSPFTLLPSHSHSQMANNNRHTIILMQTSQNRATRTFMDYESITQAMDGICALYERKLKELNPAIRNLSYDISDLYNFIDGLADMSALVYDSSIHAYLPHDRQWIKQKTFQHLKKLAH
ncbi:hypothetical protein RIF29_27252 [Crotalaria pallida]|uniref:Enhancer of rudimentary homolog n=1 Tax=Crotalaria pallida TaxID=3830 RepID=A0AAN9I268_CROPI